MVRVPSQEQIDEIFAGLPLVAVSVVAGGVVSYIKHVDDAVTLPDICREEYLRRRCVGVVYPWMGSFAACTGGDVRHFETREAAEMWLLHKSA